MKVIIASLLLIPVVSAESLPKNIAPPAIRMVVEELIRDAGEYVFPEKAAALQSYLIARRTTYEAMADTNALADK